MPHDLVVQDDQSVVIADLYEEQQPSHLSLSGTGKSSSPGRVTIQGVKLMITTPVAATIDNYYGSLFYMSAFFMEKSFPSWQFTQTGSRDFNLTMLGNNFDTTSLDPAPFQAKLSKQTGLNMLGNALSNFSDLGLGQAFAPFPDVQNDPSNWLVYTALDDFRRLGLADLSFNHPTVTDA